jgi:hypothetical protein
MLIIKSQDYLQNAGQHRVLSQIQKLAAKVSCNSGDMENVMGRSDLLRLPTPLLPYCAQKLSILLLDDEKVVRISIQVT